VDGRSSISIAEKDTLPRGYPLCFIRHVNLHSLQVAQKVDLCCIHHLRTFSRRKFVLVDAITGNANPLVIRCGGTPKYKNSKWSGKDVSCQASKTQCLST